jgi:hypothetical protein
MRKFTTAVAVLAGAITVTGFAGQASAQPARGSNEQFTIISTGETNVSVIATGGFNAVGTATEQQVSTTTGQGTFTFPDGSIVLTHTNKPGGKSHFDPATCVGRFSGTGTYVISNGTGAYSGVTGSGTFHVRGMTVSAHTPDGCGDAPIAVVTITRAHGRLSRP